MNAASMWQSTMTVLTQHVVLERLFFASLEFFLLAATVALVLRAARPNAPRLVAFSWVLVLAKPVVSLALGSPLHVVQFETRSLSYGNPAAPAALPVAPSAPGRTSAGIADVGRRAFDVEELPAISEDRVAPETERQIPQERPVSARLDTRLHLIAWLWITGVAVCGARGVIDGVRVHRMIAQGRVPGPELASRYHEVAGRLGLHRTPPLVLTDAFDSPVLAGVIRPAVLLPCWLGEQTPGPVVEWALRHELTHWRNCDPLLLVVREVTRALFFFHPAAWWVGQRLEENIEIACDRAIVADEAEATEYAQRLFELLEQVGPQRRMSLASGTFAARTQIGRRIAALVRRPLATRSHLGVGALTAIAVSAVLMFSLGAGLKRTEQPGGDDSALALTQTAIDPADQFVFIGRVVDPDGKPFAGAQVHLVSSDQEPASNRLRPKILQASASGADGRFRFEFRKSSIENPPWHERPWEWVSVTAVAAGYGPVWTQARKEVSGEEFTLRLVADGVPVEGRIVDLEGRPIAAATVRVEYLREPRSRAFDEYLAALKQDGSSMTYSIDWNYLEALAVVMPAELKTDSDGRFRLTGVGRERQVQFVVLGDAHDRSAFWISTRRNVDFAAIFKAARRDELEERFGGGRQPVYGPRFTHVAGPSQPIVGTIRERDSGKPLPGCRITATAGSQFGENVVAISDAQGSYRIAGLPAQNRFRKLIVDPPRSQPYFRFEQNLPQSPGLDPIRLDFELYRGIVVKGRVTDGTTGEPLRASIRYFSFSDNPFGKSIKHRTSHGGLGTFDEVWTDRDGRYAVVALPGPGVVAAIAVRRQFCVARPEHVGRPADQQGMVAMEDGAIVPGMYNEVRPINPAEHARELTLDVDLRRGQSVRIIPIGPDGKGLSGCVAFGSSADFVYAKTFSAPEILATAFEPDRPREVILYHAESRTGFARIFTGSEGQPFEARLQPCGIITGRLVDADGRPVPSRELEYVFNGLFNLRGTVCQNRIGSPTILTDKEGIFRLDAVPGVEYWLPSKQRVTLRPGERKELGDIDATQ